MTLPNDHLTLEILGIDGVLLLTEKITSINVRMENGALIGLRPGHAPLIGSVAAGIINYKIGSDLKKVKVNAGLLSIRENKIRILTTGSQKPDIL